MTSGHPEPSPCCTCALKHGKTCHPCSLNDSPMMWLVRWHYIWPLFFHYPGFPPLCYTATGDASLSPWNSCCSMSHAYEKKDLIQYTSFCLNAGSSRRAIRICDSSSLLIGVSVKYSLKRPADFSLFVQSRCQTAVMSCCSFNWFSEQFLVHSKWQSSCGMFIVQGRR